MGINKIICRAIYKVSKNIGAVPNPEYGWRIYTEKCLSVTVQRDISGFIAQIIGQILEDFYGADLPGDDIIDIAKEVIRTLSNPSYDVDGLKSVLYWPNIILTPKEIDIILNGDDEVGEEEDEEEEDEEE